MKIPNIEIYADGASLADIIALADSPMISGFTTNPSLMKQAGVASYEEFARAAVLAANEKSLSLEVVADELDAMEREAKVIASWGKNVRIKIPVTTTLGESCIPVVRSLLDRGIPVNVTAVLTDDQVRKILSSLRPTDDAIISVFAGRIADTGRDPLPVVARYVSWSGDLASTKFLWASPRELLNVWHAAESGCQIITLPKVLLDKLPLLGRDLAEYSLETVRMFFEDAQAAGIKVEGAG